jgi:DNA-binding NarL/FixJ family response regulator
MICDDSMVIRGAIARILEADPEIRVVAKVANGRAAVDEIRRTPVDVVILDIEMPWTAWPRCRFCWRRTLACGSSWPQP